MRQHITPLIMSKKRPRIATLHRPGAFHCCLCAVQTAIRIGEFFRSGVPNGSHEYGGHEGQGGQHPEDRRPITVREILEVAYTRTGEYRAKGTHAHREPGGNGGGFRMAEIDRRRAAHQHIGTIDHENLPGPAAQ